MVGAGVAVTLLLLVLVLVPARGIDPAPQGLAAEYFQNDTLTAPRALERVDRRPSTTTLTTAWRDAPPDVFSVRWTGVLVRLREGNYTLATRSDDGSRVVVDREETVVLSTLRDINPTIEVFERKEPSAPLIP